MSKQDCPACGVGKVTISQEWNNTDGGPYSTPLFHLVIDDQTCECELTDEQVEHLDEMAANATAWERD